MIQSYVIKLWRCGDPKGAQRAVKGSTVAFPQDIRDLGKKLPIVNCLDQCITKVVFIGDPSRAEEVKRAKKYLLVRREKVRAALVYLCSHHRGFMEENITVDHEEVDLLPLNDVPDSILSKWISSVEEDLNESESSEYTDSHPVCSPSGLPSSNDVNPTSTPPTSTVSTTTIIFPLIN